MPFCNKTVTFYDHPEKERILNWLNSDTIPNLSSKHLISQWALSYIKKEIINGMISANARFSQNMEKRVLEAVRLYESEKNHKYYSGYLLEKIRNAHKRHEEEFANSSNVGKMPNSTTISFYNHPEKELIKKFLQSRSHKSSAEEIGCSTTTISVIKKEINKGEKLPHYNFSTALVNLVARVAKEHEERNKAVAEPDKSNNFLEKNCTEERPFCKDNIGIQINHPIQTKEKLLNEMIAEELAHFNYEQLKKFYADLIQEHYFVKN